MFGINWKSGTKRYEDILILFIVCNLNFMFWQLPGIQRLRCYPMQKTENYAGRRFHGKNQCDLVALMPTSLGYDEFEYPSDARNPVEIARLQLLFDFTITPAPGIPDLQMETVEAAFVQRLAPFADERGYPLFQVDDRTKRRICKLHYM